MGNSQTCVDCNTQVPIKVKWLDNIGGNWGRRYCKWANNETWIKLGSDEYLCSPCLVKRQNQERQKQQEGERRKEHEKRQEEKRTHKKRRRLQEKKQEEKIFNRQEEERKNSEKRQFLLSEERLANWERREKGTVHDREQSQIFKESLPKGMFHNLQFPTLTKYIPNSREEQQIDVVQQKDNGYVLQEMVARGNINDAESLTIDKVLLIVQEKIKSYENQNKFNPLKQSPDHQLVKRFCFKWSNFTDHEKEFSDFIFEICLAVKLSKTYWPRNTQIIALSLMIKAIQKGILLEINTGEGKTCIIAMFSAFLASCQIAVDIVSSSPILAQRDYVEWKTFYKILKISVNCNLIPKKTAERLKCYSNKVVYGTVGSFASDLLRQTFLMENVRGERKCEAVIVDEVDCMLLDQGVHFTYLSHAVPGMHHIEPILFMIWKQIVKHEKIVSDKSENFFLGVLDSLQVVLSSYVDLSELFDEENIPPEIQWLYLFEKNLLSADFTKHSLNGNNSEYKDIFTIEKILECLKFVEENFNLLIRFQPYIILNETTVQEVQWEHSNNATKEQIIHLLVVGEGLLCVLHPYEEENEIHYFVKDQIKNYISFDGSNKQKHHIPSYLEEYVENRLISWVENAFTAKHMTIGREYLVKDNDVVPVDFEATGVVQFDTKWGDCLHQFLEIKHGKKLSPITLVTNFMSNQEYFSRYKGKIFGVSGTLGTQREKSFLMKQFSLGSKKIPTHRSKVFEELPGIICNSKHEWIIAIKDIVREQVTKTANKMKRAVLVICEDINTAKELKTNLIETVCSSVALYTRNDETNEKIDSKLKAGDIIVATNIAGRGTDIDIDETVEKAGGLFVLVTFLPQNSRIENQVFGRSARKGQPGSGQIVLNRHSLPLYFSLHKLTCIESLKHLRDAIEEKRIIDIEKHAFEEVRLKENLFAHYCSFLCEIKQLNFKRDDEKIMLDSLHEYWGMWLKMNCETKENRFRTKNLKSSLNIALKTAKRKICQKNSPCSNVSHIIKFANEQLFKDYARSEVLFTKAIEIDKKWAAISFYNRAYCSLLKREPGYITQTIDDLSKSQECFALFKEEAVLCLTLSSSMNDENDYEEEVSGTASQFNSRCQIINYFEENIKSSIQKLREFQKANKEVTAESTSIFTIVLGDDNTSKKIESEIYVFYEMGLTQIIFVKERKPFCWKGMLIIALGVLQIAVGAVIVASTAGILTQLGWGLIAEGVNDICTGAYAVWKNDQDFMKSWMVGKAVSIAVSVASFGYNQAKTATKGVKGVRAAAAAIKQHVKTGANKAVSEFKAIGSMITSKSFRPVFRATCVGVGTEVGFQLCRRGGKYLLEVAQEKVCTLFEDIARESIKQETQFAFTKGDMYPVVDDFIANYCKDENIPNNEISAKYMDITKKLLCSENICQFRQVLLGCVKDVIKTTSKQMKTKQTDIFEQCKPLLDIIDEISCAKYDIKHLVLVYCKHVNTALNDIYKESLTNKAFSYFKEDDHELCTIKQQIIDRTAQYLYSLLKESFKFTGSGILAEKLQSAVGQFVNEHSNKSLGKDTIGKIIAISSKATKKGISAFKSGKTEDICEAATDIVADGLDKFADDNVKRKANFALNATKKGVSAYKSGKTGDICEAATDIVADGLDKFADDNVKRKANFALNATKKGVLAYKSGKTEDICEAATDIVADGLDKFADDNVKRKANFALNATKNGVLAYKSGKTEDIGEAATDIVADGLDKFADDNVKRKANFVLNATKKGVSAYKSGKTGDICEAATDIVADGLDKFADDNVKRKANFVLNATKKGVSAYKSGKTGDICEAATDIVADGLDKFADDNVKRKANFALNATKKGVSAYKSGKTEDICEAATNIVADGLEKFADDNVKRKANFALNATKKGVLAYKSGKTEDICEAATDIVADGLDKFANDNIKRKANFALNATKKGVSAYKSGKTEDICKAATDIVADGLDKFADDNVKRKANFALNATKKGVLAYKSGKSEDMFEAATDIVADGLDKFADDNVKRKANFALNATKKGVLAYKSGKTENICEAATDIVADGLDKFADDNVKRKANFALNATKKGVLAYKSGKTEDICEAATDIVANGLDKLADDNVKRKANFALNATKKGVSAYKSGKTEDVSDAATDIGADRILKTAYDDVKRRANFGINAFINADQNQVETLKSDTNEDMCDTATEIVPGGINKSGITKIGFNAGTYIEVGLFWVFYFFLILLVFFMYGF